MSVMLSHWLGLTLKGPSTSLVAFGESLHRESSTLFFGK